MTEQELANVIWDIKEVIRNSYDDSEVEDVILPFTLLRRLDCVLEDKCAVLFDCGSRISLPSMKPCVKARTSLLTTRRTSSCVTSLS